MCPAYLDEGGNHAARSRDNSAAASDPCRLHRWVDRTGLDLRVGFQKSTTCAEQPFYGRCCIKVKGVLAPGRNAPQEAWRTVTNRASEGWLSGFYASKWTSSGGSIA
jgi:hypothetical protein